MLFKKFTATCCLIAVFFLAACSKEKPASYDVIVSIPPYKKIVEEIAGDTVSVGLMVPPGGSPHAFEPTLKQVLAAENANVWFLIGEPFEERAVEAMKSANTRLKTVDLREGISLITDTGMENKKGCPHHGCADPHVWLSPNAMKRQAETIARTLSSLYPENAPRYKRSLAALQKKLDDLDDEIERMLQPVKNRTLVVSHPAFAYFCRDFGFKQLSIEFEGKEPSPQQLTQILKKVREVKPRFLYIQEQHQSKGARLVAETLGIEIVEIDPLDENYFENMQKIARDFARQ